MYHHVVVTVEPTNLFICSTFYVPTTLRRLWCPRHHSAHCAESLVQREIGSAFAPAATFPLYSWHYIVFAVVQPSFTCRLGPVCLRCNIPPSSVSSDHISVTKNVEPSNPLINCRQTHLRHYMGNRSRGNNFFELIVSRCNVWLPSLLLLFH